MPDTKPVPVPAAQPIPKWVNTMPEMDYHLEAWGSESDTPDQKIPLDQEEYAWLKQQLAIRRGYSDLPEVESAHA